MNSKTIYASIGDIAGTRYVHHLELRFRSIFWDPFLLPKFPSIGRMVFVTGVLIGRVDEFIIENMQHMEIAIF